MDGIDTYPLSRPLLPLASYSIHQEALNPYHCYPVRQPHPPPSPIPSCLLSPCQPLTSHFHPLFPAKVLVATGQVLILHGGFHENHHLDDMWYFNITSKQWLEKKTFVSPRCLPNDRCNASSPLHCTHWLDWTLLEPYLAHLIHIFIARPSSSPCIHPS